LAEPFLGEIKIFSFPWPPRGWALCNGALLSISQNAALFSLIGTQYGGNGTSNFALPDMRGRTPIHFGPIYTQGEQDGVENVTLTLNQMPLHNHTLMGASAGDKTLPNNAALANVPVSTDFHYAPDSPTQTLNPSSMQYLGGGIPHNNLQPFLVLNYCIATQGIFPSRN
jgi:microcystin-dependent protein